MIHIPWTSLTTPSTNIHIFHRLTAERVHASTTELHWHFDRFYFHLAKDANVRLKQDEADDIDVEQRWRRIQRRKYILYIQTFVSFWNVDKVQR